MTEFAASWQVYRDFGVAGLFILLYLSTVIAFVKDLKEQRKTQSDMVERVIKSMESSAAVTGQCVEVLKEVRQVTSESTKQNAEFLSYLKGRDSA